MLPALREQNITTYLDHVGRDVTDTTSPAIGRVVEDVVDAEALVLGGERVEVLLEQNVLLRDVGEDEVDLGAVASALAAADDGLDDLQHGGDASAAGNHAEVAHHVGSVREGALGPAHANGLAGGERGEVSADVACRVRLDQQVEVTGLLVAADGRVRADDLLGGAIGLREDGADADVLPDGEAEEVRGTGEGESVAIGGGGGGRTSQQEEAVAGGEVQGRGGGRLHGGVVRQDGLFLQLKLLEDGGLERLLRFCAGSSQYELVRFISTYWWLCRG